MKTKILLVFLNLLITSLSFAQPKAPEKKVFIYKSIKGHHLKANIFLPNTHGVHPVLVYFHGGGFIFGNRDEGLHSALRDKFLADGYAVVSADYRLAPETKLDEILSDVNDLIEWIRDNAYQKYHIDINKIAVAGGSAGAYLALSSGFDIQNAPDAIVSISPPTGFSPPNYSMGDLSLLKQAGPYDIVKDSIVSYGDYSKRMNLWRFLGRNRLALYEIFGFDPSTNEEKLKPFKLTSHIDSNYPPTLLIHAENDHLVSKQDLKDFSEYLLKNEVKSELFLVQDGHSNELINKNPAAIDKMLSFLKIVLK